jgi:uncharacterized membrane protein HdeD (DUF308 family)
MLENLKHEWWLLLLRGACAVLFGVLAFAWPGLTGSLLVLLFGAWMLVNGVFALGIAWRAPSGMPGRGWLAVIGFLAVAAGIVTFYEPDITAVSLLFLIAAWAIAAGVSEIVVAVRLRRELRNEWALIAGGILSVLFGVLLLAWPSAGALSIVWLIGGYAIAFGLLLLVAAFRLHGVVAHVRQFERTA